MPQDQDPTRRGLLRVTLHETEVQDLMRQYPKLTRTEICDIITRKGPMRSTVEAELEALSDRKR